MKKQLAFLSVALLVAAPFVLLGCGGDDDPVDPPTENCSVTVTTPAQGDAFIPGDADNQTVRIRWDESGDADNVTIELLKTGVLVDTIASNVPNTGFYQWIANNMGSPNGTDFTIRVAAEGETDCQDQSGQFSLTNTAGCSLAFTNEFDPEVIYVAGNELVLTWDSSYTLGNVSIELWRQDQALGLINDLPLDDDGSFTWTIDSLNGGTYAYYYLKLLANGVDDCFAESITFEVADEDVCMIAVISPQPDEVWTEGESRQINLTATSDVTAVDLRLYKGNDLLGFISIDSILVSDLPYTWTSVDDFGEDSSLPVYRIRAISADDQYCVGESELFTIMSQ